MLKLYARNQVAWFLMADEKQRQNGFKAKLVSVFRSRNVQVGILLVIAMIIVFLLMPFITTSSVLYPWFIPLVELVLGGLLIVIVIMNHLDAEVQRIRDEAGLERTGKLLPRRKKEGWFFSLDNVYNGISLAYLALKAYIVLLAKDGYLSFTFNELATELKVGKQKEDLVSLLAMASDEGLLVAVPGKNKYMIVGLKDKNISIKKDVKKRMSLDHADARSDQSSRSLSKPAKKR